MMVAVYVVLRQKISTREEYGREKHTIIKKSGAYGKSWRPRMAEVEYYDRIELWVETQKKCRLVRAFVNKNLGIYNFTSLYL